MLDQGENEAVSEVQEFALRPVGLRPAKVGLVADAHGRFADDVLQFAAFRQLFLENGQGIGRLRRTVDSDKQDPCFGMKTVIFLAVTLARPGFGCPTPSRVSFA